MFISPTVKNAALASAVNNRIKADGSMIAAKALLWRLTGAGVFCLLAGGGIGLSLLGYSYVADSRTSAQQMATAFADALEHANLGTVRLNPESTVKLDPAATVRLDPAAALKLTSLPSERPSDRQAGGGTDAKTVTNYTIFKSTAYGKGFVETGWRFSSSGQTTPDEQYCYYQEKSPSAGQSLKIDLGENGQPLDFSETSAAGLDAAAAYQRCVWLR